MSTDDIIALLNRAASRRLADHCRAIVDRSIFELADWDIFKHAICFEVVS